MDKTFLEFPKNFLWGASISSHQTEGNSHNSWSEWEKATAAKLANSAEKNFAKISPIWETIKPQALNPQNYISGSACDHYRLWPEDIKIASELGLNAFRFSIAWERVEPEEGIFNEPAIAHYQEVIRDLRSRNIEPFVCLWHWTLPLWLDKKGGVLSSGFAKRFRRYTEKMIKAFHPSVKNWVTLNEPEIYCYESFYRGVWPPQKKSFLLLLRSVHSLINAHKQAYAAIKSIAPQSQVSIAKNNIYYQAKTAEAINRTIKKTADFFWNEYFLNAIRSEMDFIGLNHYFHNLIDRGFGKNENALVSDLGWEMFPESIYHVLVDLKKYDLPVIILENGLADQHDDYRAWYIINYLRFVHKAIGEGVDVRGYFHWSLIDNFEWDKGFWPRFGLVEVDYQTLSRKIRTSARLYSSIIRNNGITL